LDKAFARIRVSLSIAVRCVPHQKEDAAAKEANYNGF
jgi:hypothetical protein